MKVEAGDDTADLFWPGYVDAVVNLVLNLLFVIAVMTMVVFIFALQARNPKSAPTPEKESAPHAAEPPQPGATSMSPTSTTALAPPSAELKQLQQQMSIALAQKDREIQRITQQLAALRQEADPDHAGQRRIVDATARRQEPATPLAPSVVGGPGGLVVRFADDAVALTPAEADALRVQLAEVLASGGARLEVQTPPGFSEARRLGYYRAMTIRNLLIDLKLPSERIDVVVRAGSASADPRIVSIAPKAP